jgi:hypothetical protein
MCGDVEQVKEVAREVAEAARQSPAVEGLRKAKDRLGQATAELPEVIPLPVRLRSEGLSY